MVKRYDLTDDPDIPMEERPEDGDYVLYDDLCDMEQLLVDMMNCHKEIPGSPSLEEIEGKHQKLAGDQ